VSLVQLFGRRLSLLSECFSRALAPNTRMIDAVSIVNADIMCYLFEQRRESACASGQTISVSDLDIVELSVSSVNCNKYTIGGSGTGCQYREEAMRGRKILRLEDAPQATAVPPSS